MKILVTGSGDGLGALLTTRLRQDDHEVFEYDRKNGHDVRAPDLFGITHLDCLINCAGTNKINFIEDVSSSEWDAVMDTNCKAIFMMTQAALPLLKKSKGVVVNIVSNASHVPMTASAAYCASKAGALHLTRQLARELTKRYGITVFSISPNKMSGTGMSRDIDQQVCRTRDWTPEQARKYQLDSLLVGEETPALCVADFIAFLLSSKERHKYLSGCDMPYGL